ncbi:ATP-binding cassette domain-containing protein [Saccharibacter sp. 17.LH.SD]|uniref:ABC transporter ATP-binding protein n=1 Tax=Saccharibacter sp. 17.LH.SD TaxID=2689393 RepID=UPI00136B2A5D|nr:ATP-binding cassette domain-containing protein [Saccharibacter sp. 17.LH.SD]MXV45233.1 ATP-binding cassette domain-containing protein [Saccharibacter sp. 17.LH.SD]
MTASLPRIRIRGLKKTFGSKVVLDGIDLDVETGTSTVIIGGSGTGKSVLLRCILGLIEPDEGTIEIDGEDVLRAPAHRQRHLRERIGMLFQNAALFDSMSVLDNIIFGLHAKLRAKAQPIVHSEMKQEAINLLSQVGLDASVSELSPSELSGGMQKRVGLARAIAGQPDILFFDEPTTGLDPIMGAVIDGLIVDCVNRLGSTAIAITHDMASAQRIGYHAAMLYQGKLIWQGNASDLMKSGNPIVDQFTHGRREGPIRTEPNKTQTL